jgi:hypothetical protein
LNLFLAILLDGFSEIKPIEKDLEIEEDVE